MKCLKDNYIFLLCLNCSLIIMYFWNKFYLILEILLIHFLNAWINNMLNIKEMMTLNKSFQINFFYWMNSLNIIKKLA